MDFDIFSNISDNISRVMVGKTRCIRLILVGLLAEGHVLLEDVPGVGKTVLARALAKSMGGSYKRVQFTPDLPPSDITGYNIYVQHEGQFRFQEGPVMTHILLADEINRTIPRTQSSLLESMEEKQVTVEGKTYPLPAPFFVIATQNPVELEGTFPLPEAQLDRFLLKIDLGYPEKSEEMDILKRFQADDPLAQLEPVASPEKIFSLQQARKKILVSDAVREYITDLVQATRSHPQIRYGASPRGSMALMRAAQALAALEGRDYVLPDDVKALASPVLTHRLVLHETERLRGERTGSVLAAIVGNTRVPA